MSLVRLDGRTVESQRARRLRHTFVTHDINPHEVLDTIGPHTVHRVHRLILRARRCGVDRTHDLRVRG